MKKLLITTATVILSHFSAIAQTNLPPLPEGQSWITISAQASTEVDNDEMFVVMSFSKEGYNPQEIQEAVSLGLTKTLNRIGKSEIVAKISGVNTSNVWGPQGKTDKWISTGTITLTSQNLNELNKVVAQLTDTLQIQSVNYTLTRQSKQLTEASLFSILAADLKAKAKLAAQSFDFSRWEMKSIDVQQQSTEMPRMPRPMMATMRSAEAAPMPSAGGKTTVTISGSALVLMRK